MFDKNNQVLLLTEAHYLDGGIYKCIVRNRYGSITRTSELEWRGIKVCRKMICQKQDNIDKKNSLNN